MPSNAKPLWAERTTPRADARGAGGGSGEGKPAHPQLWRHGQNLLVKGQRRGRTSTGSGWLADMRCYDTELGKGRGQPGVVRWITCLERLQAHRRKATVPERWPRSTLPLKARLPRTVKLRRGCPNAELARARTFPGSSDLSSCRPKSSSQLQS